MALQIQLRDVGGGAVSFSQKWEDAEGKEGKTSFAAIRHVPRPLNIPRMRLQPSPGHKRTFGVFRAQRTCLVAANVVLFLLNKIFKKIGANVVVSERTPYVVV